jgi:heat shock protein HslJ
MRRLALAACLATLPTIGFALSPLVEIAALIQDRDWQLLAIDGAVVDQGFTASLRIGADGVISGMAPCNSYGAKNTASLPEFKPGPIRATRRACDRLADEQVFFDTLSIMEGAAIDGIDTLILTGPDGRSMEFVQDRQTACKTCTAD